MDSILQSCFRRFVESPASGKVFQLLTSAKLIVIGDQNTGKSSVLQAITGLSFPVEDGTCTRFPIQISFRQAPGPPKVTASIVPGQLSEDDATLRERTQDFRIEQKEITPELMGQIIQEVCPKFLLALLYLCQYWGMY